jgi:hypothetical protein
LSRWALPLVCATGILFGQNVESIAGAQHRLGLIATRAIACFRAADSIQASLEARGLTLHPDIEVLRARLQAALDESDAAIAGNDAAKAGEALDRAQGLLEKFQAWVGG